MTDDEQIRQRVRALGLIGMLDHWRAYADATWLPGLLQHEEDSRRLRSVQRRVRGARIARFRPMADFDWSWPRSIDRQAVEELFRLRFVEEAANVVLVGPNAVGKTMICANLAWQAAQRGLSVRFTTASAMLNELAAQDGAVALNRALNRYIRPRLLVIDEVGYLAYGNRHADLLFEVVSRRYEERSIVLSTNKPFAEWNDVFPNATCVVTLVDRLVHRSEIIHIDADSYRLKEHKERTAKREAARSKPKDPENA
jgi:DNA replication protein DnaC